MLKNGRKSEFWGRGRCRTKFKISQRNCDFEVEVGGAYACWCSTLVKWDSAQIKSFLSENATCDLFSSDVNFRFPTLLKIYLREGSPPRTCPNQHNTVQMVSLWCIVHGKVAGEIFISFICKIVSIVLFHRISCVPTQKCLTKGPLNLWQKDHLYVKTWVQA